MSPLTYEVAVNWILLGVWLTVALLLLQRMMEKREFTYRIQKTPEGLVFKYSLGIYAGCVRITRDEKFDEPVVRKRSDGWQFTFPIWYTEEQIQRWILYNDPTAKKGRTSHRNDLEIFRQVVLKNNDNLFSIRGKVFTGDRRKNPR